MSSASTPASGQPEPAWEIARLFPPQGRWSEGSYLSFTESLNQLVELVNGSVEVLEMPTKSHQKTVQYLLNRLLEFLSKEQLGDAISAPYRIRLRDLTYREPDLVVYLSQHLSRFGERYGDGADLVIEVVSDDAASRQRDYEDKRRDYSEAGIPEYWIVDPAERKITVLGLKDSQYLVLGEFGAGDMAESKLLEGFQVSLNDLLSAAQV